MIGYGFGGAWCQVERELYVTLHITRSSKRISGLCDDGCSLLMIGKVVSICVHVALHSLKFRLSRRFSLQ